MVTTYGILRVRFRVWIILGLNENTSVTTVRVAGNTFINAAVNQRKIRAAIVDDDSERGCRGCILCKDLGGLSRMHLRTSYLRLPLLSNNRFTLLLVVWVRAGFLCLTFAREVYVRISTNGLAVGVHPSTPNVARVILILQRGLFVVVSRYVMKKRKLEE